MSPPRKLDHPSFGQCELVPFVIAIRWKHRLAFDTIISKLRDHSLTLATEVPGFREQGVEGRRDPRPVRVNQSETLTWATGQVTEATLAELTDDEDVSWVAPVYRAIRAVPGPQSYFAINPTVLLLTQDAVTELGELSVLDESISIDVTRSKLLKSFVVLNVPQGNAIEVAEKIQQRLGTFGAGKIKFENFPYISPTTSCGHRRSDTDGGHGGDDRHGEHGGGCRDGGHGGPSGYGKHRDHCGYCGHGGHGGHGGGKRGRCSPATFELVPNDELYPTQWGLQRINAPRAWPISEGNPKIVIAVLDEGVELGHPDLHLWPVSWSTITHTNDGSPVGNHGTACAGIIGGRINNAIGVAGLAGKCRVMAISTNFADTEVTEGLYWAADNGARVVSMSFGVYPSWMIWDFAIIEAALQYCQQKGLVLVAATGNEDQNMSRFPATDPTTLGVGGSNRADVRKAVGDTSVEAFWGACFGPDVDVVAPCLEIPTTDRLGAAGYTPTAYDPTFNGTSAATPHVAALAGLILSVNPWLTNVEVRAIISETTDKINQPGYIYLPTAGKPFGTWNAEVGYGRINAERALLVACTCAEICKYIGPCCVEAPAPDKCCVSPCDPPWRSDEQCMFWYETRSFRVPLGREGHDSMTAVCTRDFIEFCITYEHKLCLLGKQHGPLLYTQTLLPGEKVTLYHSDRYRRITNENDRFSVQTTFLQFLSAVHQARATNTLELLSDKLVNVKGNTSVSVGGGLAGLLGLPSGSSSPQINVTDHDMLRVERVAEAFNQSVIQSSQMTHAERSVVVSNYEDKDVASVTARTIQNDNECRAVTYFIRKVVELYALSTKVTDVSFRMAAPNVPSGSHSINDIGRLPTTIKDEIKKVLALLPKVGQVIEHPRPVALPTDGTVYDPELAHCSSCEPEREAAISITLEKQKAEALQACLEARALELELERRRLRLQKGELGPFGA